MQIRSWFSEILLVCGNTTLLTSDHFEISLIMICLAICGACVRMIFETTIRSNEKKELDAYARQLQVAATDVATALSFISSTNRSSHGTIH